jgi:adenylate cyclase
MMRGAARGLSEAVLPQLGAWLSVRNLRLVSGLILFTYIAAHLCNHALGLVSLETAEAGMAVAVEVWYSWPGTLLLYGAAAVHFLVALWAVYERRTFRLPPAELLRIALGFTLPILLIGHAVSTRLAYDLFGLSSDYTRVVAVLWASDSQGRQLGLLAPGWLHGCLGLHFVFNRRPLYRQLRYVLFGAALLLPVLSALGFIAMGRELATNPTAAAMAQAYLSPANDRQRVAIAQLRDGILLAYFAIVGAAFGARAIRNALERGRRRLISISYPGRTVRVPGGWTVLEASRSFHIPHASMCGGRARCSTCRIRVTAGEDVCPPAERDERATLGRIGAAADGRLACQLRPRGDISVIPLMRTERPVYRLPAAQPGAEREIVVLFCDFLNRGELAGDHMPQDLLYLLMRYVDAIGHAIRMADGALSSVRPDSICALFGLEDAIARAARQALQAAAAVEGAIADLNDRLGREGDSKVRIAISIHAGRAAVGEIGQSDPPTVMAVGEAMDVVQELRKLVAGHGKALAISRPVYVAAGLEPPAENEIMVEPPGSDSPIAVSLCDSAPVSPGSTGTGFGARRAALQRMWKG